VLNRLQNGAKAKVYKAFHLAISWPWLGVAEDGGQYLSGDDEQINVLKRLKEGGV